MRLQTAKEAFSKNTYDTPEDTPHYPGDYFLLRSRWWLYLRFAGVILKYSWLARRGQLDNENWVKASFRVFQHIEGCGGRFHISGLEYLRQSNEPVVIVSNHMSTLETVVFPGIIVPFRPLTFVVKNSLVKGRVFGPIMRSREPIVVSRSNPREDFKVVMEQGINILKNGKSLVIFPQATRTTEFDPDKFNTLGVKLASKSGVKLLPMAIRTDFWGDSKIIKGFGALDRKKHIYIAFGEPMEINNNGKDEHKKVIQFITSHLEKWGMDMTKLKK